MKVLVACEESQRVTIELRKLGNEAYFCDLFGGFPSISEMYNDNASVA